VNSNKVALVTGTSTGIGLTTSLHLARNGYTVFAGMRNPAKADVLRETSDGLPVHVVEMDVTDDTSIEGAVAAAGGAGAIDVLINNAGLGGATPLELTPMTEHEAMFQTNYFGAIRCIQAVLPAMRERGSGCIVNITSMEGLVAIPDQVAYSASKWALECAGEALAHEVYRFGVRVVNVEPGVIMTNIFKNSAAMTRFDKTSPYIDIMRRNGKMFAAGFRSAAQPELVAETILEAIETDNYRLRWPVGEDAHGIRAGRSAMSDEQWIAMGGDLSDDEYNSLYQHHFGIELR
jgi:NAD(P)-dependent dehydrogenase (short-subunit alcohol dehydrogenase family)